ncbi:ABC transporter permease subunit [Arenibacter sp. GZD96]|uniref:ABC transporter permease n=1 Tax=Aurantibrevibacter litoralis TaxID=3106030 RepID=UPI002AFECCE3|nr:ABC transporter permease subunit [Arenibacter sp. GZD-96]MEA1786429.1 ABC transporter permease subunit [Arenibacter sp. GZD-96]
MKLNWKHLVLALAIGLILFPFVYMVFLSLLSDWRFPDLKPTYFGLKNWHMVLGSEVGLLQSFLSSVLISLSVAVAATSMGFLISKAVFYHPKKRILTLFAYFPYILAPVVFAACLSYFFLKLGLFGNMAGVILAQFSIAFPYALLFFSSFWNTTIKNYEDLATTLGSNPCQRLTKVVLPLAKGLLLICFFQTFLVSWFEFGLTSIIGIGKVQTLTIKVFLFIKEANYHYGALSCCLLIFPPVVLLYLNKRYVFKNLV